MGSTRAKTGGEEGVGCASGEGLSVRVRGGGVYLLMTEGFKG